MRSLVVLIPTQYFDSYQAMAEELNYIVGGGVNLSPTGALPATYVGIHDASTDARARVMLGEDPTVSPEVQSATSLCIVSMDGRSKFDNDEENPTSVIKGRDHFNQVLLNNNLKVIEEPI